MKWKEHFENRRWIHQQLEIMANLNKKIKYLTLNEYFFYNLQLFSCLISIELLFVLKLSISIEFSSTFSLDSEINFKISN